MTTHTPGPRRLRDMGHGYYVVAEPRPGVAINVGWYPTTSTYSADGSYSIGLDESRANARLDAAAPQMLAELERLVQAVELVEARSGWPLDAAGYATLNGARTAIAAAKGDEP